MLTGTEMKDLPKDILDQIWTIYGKWRNVELWRNRYDGFLMRGARDKHIKNITKRNINLITNTIRYVIPSKVFHNYYDMLFLESTINIEEYRLSCGRCGKDNISMETYCNHCDAYYCYGCMRFHHGHGICSLDPNMALVEKL